MKKILLTIITVTTMAAAFANSSDMRPVIITGKVINVNGETPKVIKFNFCNPLGRTPQSAQLNAANEFKVSEDMLYTQNMTVNYSNYFINLFVQPGDSVHLTIDASLLDKGGFGWLAITGSHANISSQLNLCVDYLYKLPVAKSNMALAPGAMMASVKQDYQRYLHALNSYAEEHQLSPVVVKWASMDVKYLISNSISDYGGLKTGTEADRKARINMFTDPFFDMDNPDNFQSMMFSYHLDNYSFFIKGADSSIAIALKQSKKAEALKKISALLLTLPATECRDYMLYHQMATFAASAPHILDSLGDIAAWYTKAVYYDKLKKMAEVVTKPIFSPMLINGISYLNRKGKAQQIAQTDAFNYLTKKYPGKVLYIDVYATWCGPCLEEMKYSRALYQSMQGKDVVFVALCLQSDVPAWRKLLTDKHIKGENYFFTDDATKLFMGTYKLQGYPSYILVNKKGEITTTNAPRPSETAELNRTLMRLVEEKI